MEKLIQKEYRWRCSLICTIVLFLLSFVLIPFIGIASCLAIFPLAIVAWILGVLYFANQFPLVRDLRRLEKNGMMDVTEGINLERPLSSAKNCKIYCGRRAFLCRKPGAIIPYSDVAWVYIFKQTMYGVVTVDQSIVIYTKDGKKHTVSGTQEECRWLLEQYILPQSPQVVIGYGPEQKKQYLSRNPEAANANNRKKVIWGGILLFLGAWLVIACIVNHPVETPAYVLTAAVLIAGLILVLLGKKK